MEVCFVGDHQQAARPTTSRVVCVLPTSNPSASFPRCFHHHIIYIPPPRIWQPLWTRPAPHICEERGKGAGGVVFSACIVWQHFRFGAKPKREWSGPNPEPEHIGIGIISSVPHHYVHRFKHSRHHPSCHAMPWHAIAIAPVCVYVICDIVQFWLGHTYTRLPKHRMMRWGYLSLSPPLPLLSGRRSLVSR